jgi:hypothetical protein
MTIHFAATQKNPPHTTEANSFLSLNSSKSIEEVIRRLPFANLKNMPESEDKHILTNMLSKIYGVPVRNNVELLEEKMNAKRLQDRIKKYPLHDLLCMPRPNDDDPSLDSMRKYWISHGLHEQEFYKQSPLFSLLFPETPYDDECTHNGLKRYALALLQEVARRKVVSGTECAQGLDKEHIKEFLKEIALLDGAVATLWGVHFLLGIVSILKAGTEEHQELIQDCEELIILCCLMLTELGHGSNVQGLETTATFDEETEEWILDSPNKSKENPTSLKWWPGGLAINSNVGIVFSQVILNGECCGVHAFLVKIRDENGNNLKGITTGSVGPKIELNGIDNGWSYFDKMRVPKNALLNKFADVRKNGDKWEFYLKDDRIKDPHKAYIHLMDEFIRGREFIFYMSGILHESATAIFDAFPPPSLSPEHHHQELINLLADTYMLQLSESLIEGDEKFHPKYSKAARRDDHILASVLKATSSDMGEQCLRKLEFMYNNPNSKVIYEQIVRNAKKNRAPQIYEGENNMLYLLGSSFILLKVLRKDTDKWEEAVAGYDIDNPKTLDDLPFYQRPLILLKREMLQSYYAIAESMMKSVSEGKNPETEFHTGSGAGAIEAVRATKMWGKLLIMEEAYANILKMEKTNPERADVMKALYVVFANNHCQRAIRKPYKQKEIYSINEYMKGDGYKNYKTHDLVADFMRPLPWLYAMFGKPNFSVPYVNDDNTLRAKL